MVTGARAAATTALQAMTTRDDDETPRDAPRSARFGVARALEEHRGVDDVRPGLALAFDGASGGAFGTTTTTRERGDVDAFDAAIELRGATSTAPSPA